MKEVCFILCGDRIVGISDGSSIAIPDSASRWETIWNHREEISEIVHTHPGGSLQFSDEDLSTMEAVEAALGRPLRWSIVTEKGFFSRFESDDCHRADHPSWLDFLRLLSFGRTSGPPHQPRTKQDHACTD